MHRQIMLGSLIDIQGHIWEYTYFHYPPAINTYIIQGVVFISTIICSKQKLAAWKQLSLCRHFMPLLHTNTIEDTWAGIKRTIPVRNRNKDTVEEHILTFIWRRQNEGSIWKAFIKTLADTCYL
jgi:hypothetical protein